MSAKMLYDWHPLVRASTVLVTYLVVILVGGCTTQQSKHSELEMLSYPAMQSLVKITQGDYVIRRDAESVFQVLRVEHVVTIHICEYTGIDSPGLTYMPSESLRDGTAKPFPSLNVLGTLLAGDFASLESAIAGIESHSMPEVASGVCWALPIESSQDWALYGPKAAQ